LRWTLEHGRPRGTVAVLPGFFLPLAIVSGLSQGATTLIANALQSKKSTQARLIFAQSLTFTFFSGLAVSGVGRMAAPALFRQLGAEGD
jgi:Na+-driven multidrug efflux pump